MCTCECVPARCFVITTPYQLARHLNQLREVSLCVCEWCVCERAVSVCMLNVVCVVWCVLCCLTLFRLCCVVCGLLVVLYYLVIVY